MNIEIFPMNKEGYFHYHVDEEDQGVTELIGLLADIQNLIVSEVLQKGEELHIASTDSECPYQKPIGED